MSRWSAPIPMAVGELIRSAIAFIFTNRLLLDRLQLLVHIVSE
jgi:hypothetical protein